MPASPPASETASSPRPSEPFYISHLYIVPYYGILDTGITLYYAIIYCLPYYPVCPLTFYYSCTKYCTFLHSLFTVQYYYSPLSYCQPPVLLVSLYISLHDILCNCLVSAICFLYVQYFPPTFLICRSMLLLYTNFLIALFSEYIGQ